MLSERLSELMLRTPWPIDVVALEHDVRAIVEDYATVDEMKDITKEALIRSIVEGMQLIKSIDNAEGYDGDDT